MVETLSKKHTYQLIVHNPFQLWISVSKKLISESYICLISISSPLKILHNQKKHHINTKEIKIWEKNHRLKRYFYETNLFIDKFIVIW